MPVNNDVEHYHAMKLQAARQVAITQAWQTYFANIQAASAELNRNAAGRKVIDDESQFEALAPAMQIYEDRSRQQNES